MFTAQELRDQIRFALDAENSDHYRDDLDIIPSINAAIKWLTSVVNTAYGQDKIGEEFFRELSSSGVFRTSDTSRVSLSIFPTEVWSILAVYPKPTTKSITGVPAPPTPDNTRSYYLSNKLHVSSQLSCKRLNLEQWSVNYDNPFEAGYQGDQICESLKLYAYLTPINYQGFSTSYLTQELEIRPSSPNEEVTIFWAKKPTQIVNLTDEINFPHSVFQLLFDKALNYIAYKQGDQTNIYGVTAEDIKQLLTVL
jgi:hypothetical protein